MTTLYEAVLSEIDQEIRAHEDAVNRLGRDSPGEWEATMKGKIKGLQNARGILHRNMNRLTIASPVGDKT